MQLTPFHIAVQVRDIDEARDFYGIKMGFPEGRSSDHWIDYNMFGHQFVTHLNPQIGKNGKIPNILNQVDGHGVPVPHCGVVMNFDDWEVFAKKISGCINDFIIEPCVRFKGNRESKGRCFFPILPGMRWSLKHFGISKWACLQNENE